ncbi:coenzyme F420-0:L-glutamate ligase [Dolosicoccus paucivorans]|uniref:F420-0--gamma-glutamyl ligase n=1 Tax=Dolosicoccus paucivorans TaxID=84521 RepID=A0A1G8LX01_9LACT|nr:coenzyme F420-0:L-glutamate ligase [Dolosicoccus paucivorans]PMB84211.1 F420-0--gamma-glutamyl ligase [Dolosicoccus paucivorans]PMC58674.1 F420-0--gamma-glutamyl ligase [Dolosicoccus paucivorans]SDI60198.1 F420-0:Gamma-glutamyl ligase [Dolosicoccus paucivorans]
MERLIGTVTRGIRTPIIKEGDDLVQIVTDSVINALDANNVTMQDQDIVCITESLQARSQGNFATIDQIAKDVASKYSGEIGIVFPILSRNRFAVLLKGIAKAGLKLHILLSYPADEVGNHLMDERLLMNQGINPYTDVLEEADYRKMFGDDVRHTFTGVDYVNLYKEIAPNCEIHLSNDPQTILNYTDQVLICSVHDREHIKKSLKDSGASVVYGLDDLLTEPVDGSGYNQEYGLLGSNTADETSVKLFPRDCQTLVDAVQERLQEHSGKQIEVMIYGDGAFKDPVGKIWELADPVVSPAYTSGLEGTPNEIKIKYVADNEMKHLSSDESTSLIRQKIKEKQQNESEDYTIGTTPRRLTDLIGTLADLTSGSGDKGTPVVYIQGYFDDYASN